jgi:hypothetical protein
MTKIDDILPVKPAETRPAPKPAPRTRGDAFGKALQDALGQAAPQDAPRAAAEPFDPMAHLAGLKPPAAPARLGPLQTEGLMRAERILDILGQYESLLGDHAKSLKETAHVVDRMDDEVRELTKVLDKLDPKDGLYGILREAAVTAMVQSIKFNRGDYLPDSA